MKARALAVAAVAALLGGCGWVVLTQTTRPTPADCPAPAPRQGYEKADAGAPDAALERGRR